MATNAEIITGALELLGVLSETMTLSDEQAAHGLIALSDLLSEWEAHGIHLGHYTPTQVADDFPSDAATFAAVKYTLAVHLAPHYGIAVRPEVGTLAERFYQRLLVTAVYDRLTEQDMTHLPSGRDRVDIDTGSL